MKRKIFIRNNCKLVFRSLAPVLVLNAIATVPLASREVDDRPVKKPKTILRQL